MLTSRLRSRESLAVRIVISFIAMLVAFVPELKAQAGDQGMPVDAAKREAIIDSVTAALNEGYIFADVAEEMEMHVRRQLADGAYDETSTIAEFAQALSRDLLEVSHDRHLGVSYLSPEMLARMSEDRDPDEVERERREELASINYNFKRIEILPGNVGYLRFDSFVDASYSGPTAIAAMNFLAHTDALIVDLRYNGGGSPSLIQLIFSYFYDEPTHLNSFYIRRGDRTNQFWTQANVEGPRMTDVDIYVLTSERTFSGAEEFSYNMKHLGRGTIVGDTTGGGAHPVRMKPFPSLNVGVRVPFGRAVNPITGTNWEGVGVIPDVAVGSEEALEHAHVMALRTLKDEASDEQRIFALDWVIAGLEAQLNPLAVDPETLASYAGTYYPRTLTFEDGALWYRRIGNPRMRAIPMSETLFRFAEIEYFRIEVVLDESGQPVKLVGHYDNGTTDESLRNTGT
jgi:hypothetical protein